MENTWKSLRTLAIILSITQLTSIQILQKVNSYVKCFFLVKIFCHLCLLFIDEVKGALFLENMHAVELALLIFLYTAIYYINNVISC